MDAVNVTANSGFSGRAVNYDGTGVYVAVLDTGLLDSWRQFFPEQRIATQYAMSFSGGGGEKGNAPSLTAAATESILKSTAISMPPGSRTIALPGGATEVQSWSSDATGAGLATADAALKGTK